MRDLFIPYLGAGAASGVAVGVGYSIRERIYPVVNWLDRGRFRRLRLALFRRTYLKILYVLPFTLTLSPLLLYDHFDYSILRWEHSTRTHAFLLCIY